MNDDRYKQLMEQVGMPNSRSLLLALRQAANEVAQEERARSEWISVDDRMPQGRWGVKDSPLSDFSEEVLVFNAVAITVAFYNRAIGLWYTDCPAECIEWIDDVTHWQPLPHHPLNRENRYE